MITETNKVDGVALNHEDRAIILLLTDHLDWSNEGDHLMLLQEKINMYIHFLESGQYENVFPEDETDHAVIDIRFLHDITPNCEKFLQIVQDTVADMGIRIECTVTGGEE